MAKEKSGRCSRKQLNPAVELLRLVREGELADAMRLDWRYFTRGAIADREDDVATPLMNPMSRLSSAARGIARGLLRTVEARLRQKILPGQAIAM